MQVGNERKRIAIASSTSENMYRGSGSCINCPMEAINLWEFIIINSCLILVYPRFYCLAPNVWRYRKKLHRSVVFSGKNYIYSVFTTSISHSCFINYYCLLRTILIALVMRFLWNISTLLEVNKSDVASTWFCKVFRWW